MARMSSVIRLEYIIILLFGIAIGASLNAMNNSLTTNLSNTGPAKGSIKSLTTTPVKDTVHIDEQGRPITKQQLLEPFVIPNLVGFSVATFLPGQVMMPPHVHETMHELFYVIEGRGWFKIGEEEVEVGPGSFLHMAPQEKHGIWVPSDYDSPLKMVVTGVAVGEKKG
jgi:quercetin dioxygenase-like cupin family protein